MKQIIRNNVVVSVITKLVVTGFLKRNGREWKLYDTENGAEEIESYFQFFENERVTITIERIPNTNGKETD